MYPRSRHSQHGWNTESPRIREIGDSDRVVGHYEDFCNSKKVYHSIREDLPEHGGDTKEKEVKHVGRNAMCLPAGPDHTGVW